MSVSSHASVCTPCACSLERTVTPGSLHSLLCDALDAPVYQTPAGRTALLRALHALAVGKRARTLGSTWVEVARRSRSG